MWMKKEREHPKTALRTCGYQDWAFTKTSRKLDPKKEEDRNLLYSISLPYLYRVSENSRESSKNIPVQFKTSKTLRQKLVHPKDKKPGYKVTLSMLCGAKRKARNCTLGKLNSPSINEWPNTDLPLLQDRRQQYNYT